LSKVINLNTNKTMTKKPDTAIPYRYYEPFCEYPDVLTVKDLQKALNIGRNEAYRLVQENKISTIRIGRTYRIPKQCLLDYVYPQCYTDNITASRLPN